MFQNKLSQLSLLILVSLHSAWAMTDTDVLQFRAWIKPFLTKQAELMGPYAKEAQTLAADMNQRLAAGANLSCSSQIYRELQWRLHFTVNTVETRELITKLQASLSDTRDQNFANQQSPQDGLYGQCYSQDFMKLYATKDQLRTLELPVTPYPVVFLDQYNDPKRLQAFLEKLVINDVYETQELARMRIDDIISSLGRFIMGAIPQNYAFHPELKNSYLKFLDEYWQNPETKMWGTWYRISDQQILKTDDVALTFKVINQRNGQVPYLPQIAKRMLELKKYNFPIGYLVNQQYENHMNWDIVKVFRMAWPELDEATRVKIRQELAFMLDWCLKESLQPDGLFQTSTMDTTIAEALEYGVTFLSEVGFFQPHKRFWTDQDFPNAEMIRQRILKKISTMDLNNHSVRAAYQELL